MTTVKKMTEEEEEARYEFSTPQPASRQEFTIEDLDREITNCDERIARLEEQKAKFEEMKAQALALPSK